MDIVYIAVAVVGFLAAVYFASSAKGAKAGAAGAARQAYRRGEVISTIMESAGIGIIIADHHGAIKSFSKEAEQMFGYSSREAVGNNVAMLMDSPHRERHDGYMQNYMRTKVGKIIGRSREVECLRKDGSTFWGEIHLGAKNLGDGYLFVGTIKDITVEKMMKQELEDSLKVASDMAFEAQQAKEDAERAGAALAVANKELERLSSTDGLTGLYNRRTFDETLAKEWKRCARESKPLAVILLDIDSFKPYNDNYGHQAGDSCLQKVAKALAGVTSRPGDIVARYGGEEFVFVLPGTDGDHAMSVAEKARSAVASMRLKHEHSKAEKFVTISLGVAHTVPSDGVKGPELVKKADAALYLAKESGRNQARLHQAS